MKSRLRHRNRESADMPVAAVCGAAQNTMTEFVPQAEAAATNEGDDNMLLKLQEAETQILVMFDEFCKTHGLKYSLAYGTAIGAVRHGGFIPWDDDVDVLMERHEYERFLAVWREHPTDGYSLLASDDPDTIFVHTKIYKDNTIMASSEEELKKPGHHGFFLDVFPLDRIPKDKKKRKKFLYKAKLRLVYTRNHPFKAGKGLRGKILELVSRMMLLIPKKSKRRIKEKCEAYIMQYKDMPDNYEYIDLSMPVTMRDKFPKGLTDEYIDIKFGGYDLKIFAKYDMMLRTIYGDYMQPPPENERVCIHNPQIICLDTTVESRSDSTTDNAAEEN
ncbi:MAG: LicD family protein [Clostridiales bacterium]|nr:LicD family protein [Clostridiales bacterium]